MLSDKQRKFCDEYLLDLHGQNAAIRAGYARKSARVTASRLLVSDDAIAYLNKRKAVLQNKLDISQEKVLNELAKIAFSDIRKVFATDGTLKPMHDVDDDTAAALAGVESMEEFEGFGKERVWIGYSRKVKLWNKIDALEALCKYHGLFEKDNSQKMIFNVTIE